MSYEAQQGGTTRWVGNEQLSHTRTQHYRIRPHVGETVFQSDQHPTKVGAHEAKANLLFRGDDELERRGMKGRKRINSAHAHIALPHSH